MKTSLLTIVFLTLITSVLSAKEADTMKKLTGWWKSSDGDHFCGFEADGTYRVVGEEMDVIGKWKEGTKKGTIQISMMAFGATLDSTAEVKFDGDLTVDIVVEDEKMTYTRPKLEVDRKTLVGTWKSKSEDNEFGVTNHSVRIYEDEGKARYKNLYFSDKHKIYSLDEGTYKWSCSSGYLIEMNEDGADEEDEFISVSIVKSVTPDKILSNDGFDEETDYEMLRAKEAELPAPPEGFKKVSLDEFDKTIFPEEPEEEKEEEK